VELKMAVSPVHSFPPHHIIFLFIFWIVSSTEMALLYICVVSLARRELFLDGWLSFLLLAA